MQLKEGNFNEIRAGCAKE